MASEIWRSDADAKGEVTHLVPGPPYTEGSVADALLCVCERAIRDASETIRDVSRSPSSLSSRARRRKARLRSPDFARLTARVPHCARFRVPHCARD